MVRAEIEFANEIGRDVRDCYELLTDIYVEVHLLRKLAEMRVLQSRRLKEQYTCEKRRIETEAPRASSK
jgi:hypothetical protein